MKTLQTSTILYMIKPSIIAVAFSKDRKEVLLIKRRDVPVWVLPGGGIEKDETIEQALIREFQEETGYKVLIKRLVGKYTPINKLAKYTYLFECEILSGESTTGTETKDIKFFKIDNLPKFLPPPYDEWILDAHKNYPKIIEKRLYRVNYLSLFKNLILHPLLVVRFLLTRIGIYINT